MTSQTLTPPISIELTKKSNLDQVDFDNIQFGKNFSDHMLVATYENGHWEKTVIKPYQNFELSPATSAFHYGQAIFEGMKAQKIANGQIAIFRPDENLKRFNYSARRMSMPEVPEDIFLVGLRTLLKLDHNWIPTNEGCSLYIRPFMIATEPYLGVRTSDRYLFSIITCPVGSYYAGSVKVLVSDEFVRAAKGGVGDAKTAGNYARTMYPVELAKKKGYNDILWLDGIEKKYVEEVGTMNIFFVVDGKVITPKIDGTFLEGINRKSIVQIAKDLSLDVEERKISIHELTEAHDKGLLTEMFGTGTAATITEVSGFCYKGKDYSFDTEKYVLAKKFKRELDAIKLNQTPDKHNWLELLSAED